MCARPDGSSCPSLEEWSFIQQIGDLSTLKESKKQNEWQVLVQPVMSDVCPHLRLYERLSNPQTCLLNWWIATRFKQTKPMDSDAVLEVRHAKPITMVVGQYQRFSRIGSSPDQYA